MSGGKEIWVKYSFVDGAHFFTGADVLSEGLCVAHTDLKTAFYEVPVQLKNLLELNHNIHTGVSTVISLEEFSAYIAKTPPKSKIKPSVSFEMEAA